MAGTRYCNGAPGAGSSEECKVKKRAPRLAWSWLWFVLGAAYFIVPLYATIDFSLRAKRGELSLLAYSNVLKDSRFGETFLFSAEMALLTIVAGIILIVPTAYWVHMRLPKLRPVMEFITLLPFVVPAVVLVFGLIRIYAHPPLMLVSSPALLVAGYLVLALPYMYRAVDTGLRAIDIRSLTEAAQSLGATWPEIIVRVILPNLRASILSGAFVTFAIVMGEFTLASLLVWPAFGPYMNLLSSSKVYEPSALAVISFALTWGATAVIQVLSRRIPGQAPMAGPR